MSKLLPAFPYDTVGFACTSDATVLGPDTVAELVAAGADVDAAAVTNPLTAATRALKALNATKVGVLLPYTEEVSGLVVDKFEAYHIPVDDVAIFNETSDAVVARITEDSVVGAIEKIAATGVDAVFVSCGVRSPRSPSIKAVAPLGLVHADAHRRRHRRRGEGDRRPHRVLELCYGLGHDAPRWHAHKQSPRRPCHVWRPDLQRPRRQPRTTPPMPIGPCDPPRAASRAATGLIGP